jgi:hypothetical protein
LGTGGNLGTGSWRKLPALHVRPRVPQAQFTGAQPTSGFRPTLFSLGLAPRRRTSVAVQK